MSETTLVGTIVADPEVRFTPSGAAVANFTVARNKRKYNKDSGQWEDGEAVFMRCSIWRQAAENVAESLTKGMRVIVTGDLKQRNFETKEGEKRSVMELDAQEVGPSLKFATAKVAKVSRGDSPAAPADDPWGSAPPAGGKVPDEPPF